MSQVKITADLLAALKAVMGTLNYYIGPAARTAVSQQSLARYRACADAIKQAEVEEDDR